MERKNEVINIFDFDGTLTTETWPKFWVWVKKFGYNGAQRNDELEDALAEYRKVNTGNQLETFFAFFHDLLVNNNKTLTYEELILKRSNRQENDCRNVNYIGDGYSDAIAMKFVHNNGGKAIFVHQPNKDDEFYHYNNKIYQTLNEHGIVDFCCVADYTNGSILSDVLQGQKEKKEFYEEEYSR